MSKQLKYLKKLEPLLLKPLFTNAHAQKLGIPRHALAYYCKIGILRRVSPGTYQASEYETDVEPTWEFLAETASSIPEGTISLISALSIYDLTDEIPRAAWISIPHSQRVPVRSRTKIVRMRNTELGKNEISLGEYTLQIYDRERCIIDAFRYLGREVAINALKLYLASPTHPSSIKKLTEYARILRVDVEDYILALTT